VPDQSFLFHHESSGLASAPVEQVFAFLGDPAIARMNCRTDR